jgi:hypothetical protein
VKRFAENALLVVTLLATLAFILMLTGLVLDGLHVVAGQSPPELRILREGLLTAGLYVVARLAHAGHKRFKASIDQNRPDAP